MDLLSVCNGREKVKVCRKNDMLWTEIRRTERFFYRAVVDSDFTQGWALV